MDKDKSKKSENSPAYLFQPGQSGNPGGRPKVNLKLRDLCRAYTEEAIQALVEVCTNQGGRVPAVARVRAAEVLLERGYGKPVSETEHVPGTENPAAGLTDEELIKLATGQN